jgi:HK97 gp10 family phage protein
MPRAAVTRASIRRAAKHAKIDGVDETYDNLERILKYTDNSAGIMLKEEFLKAAMVLRDRAKALVPVRTGRLRDAIFATKKAIEKPNVLAGVSRRGPRAAPYANIVEYGRHGAQAHPFFRPAITSARGAMAKIIIEGFQKVIAQALGR